MTTTTTTSSQVKMRLKLFVDRNTNKVLYAEAGKDFVDFLLRTFMMPLGLAMKKVFDGAVVGGLGTLYSSVADDLSFDFLQDGSKTKAAFQNPNVIKTFYTCGFCSSPGFSDVQGLNCSGCNRALHPRGYVYVAPPTYTIERGAGYVKGLVTYMIADDLEVKPLCSSSVSMMLLSQFRIKDFGCIQEMEVTIDTNQGMELVKASLNSKTVLTDTFLPIKKDK